MSDLIGIIQDGELDGTLTPEELALAGELGSVQLQGSITATGLQGQIRGTIILQGRIYYPVTVLGVDLFINLGDVNTDDLQDGDVIIYDADTQRFINVAPSELGITGDLTYVHNQLIPAGVWNIAHNLGKYPSVVVVDSAGTTVMGEIVYDDINNLHITFTSPFSGKAFLN